MEAIQPRSTMRRRHMTAQAPSTPSVTNHVLPITILTMITIIIQVQRVTSISMSPFPLSIKRPTTEHAKLVPDWILTGSMDRQEPTPAPPLPLLTVHQYPPKKTAKAVLSQTVVSKKYV
jgi:hypothetical protein